MSELKQNEPCQFCRKVTEISLFDTEDSTVGAYCTVCGASSPTVDVGDYEEWSESYDSHPQRQQIIDDTWNRRAPEPGQPEAVPDNHWQWRARYIVEQYDKAKAADNAFGVACTGASAIGLVREVLKQGNLERGIHVSPEISDVAREVAGLMPRALLGKIVDEVFNGAIEDTQVIEDIYRVIVREQGEAEPVADVAKGYFDSLLMYSEGFYGTAIAKGMPAKDAANCVAHIERAARALYQLCTRPAPRATVQDGWRFIRNDDGSIGVMEPFKGVFTVYPKNKGATNLAEAILFELASELAAAPEQGVL